MLSPATPATTGPTRARPPVPARPTLPPDLRLPYDPNGREWRKPPRQAGAAAATSGGVGSAVSPAAARGSGTTPAQGGVPAVASAYRPPFLEQAAPVLPLRPASPAVRSWLAPLGPAVAADDWPLVSDVFRSVHPQDVNGAQAVWRSFREFAVAAGYDAPPAAERDFGSFIRSVGISAAWLRCMLRCNPGRVLLVPHPAAEPPFVAGGEEYAYLADWHSRLRHRPTVPFGHCLALVNFGGVGPLLALSPVGPPTAPADLGLEAARLSRGELVSTRRARHGAIFLPVRSGIGLAPARAPLPPEMALRCATPRLLTYENPPVIHQQLSLLQAYPCHPIQGTAYVVMSAAIVSGLLRAYRGTHRIFEPSPCYFSLTKAFSVDDLASGDWSAADALAEYDAIARAVPWAAVHERLPYHHDPTRQSPSTLLPHQVGTVADRRRHYVRIMGVPRSPHAPLGVMLAEPRLADAVPRSLPVTEEAWAVPAGFPLSDPGQGAPELLHHGEPPASSPQEASRGVFPAGGRLLPPRPRADDEVPPRTVRGPGSSLKPGGARGRTGSPTCAAGRRLCSGPRPRRPPGAVWRGWHPGRPARQRETHRGRGPAPPRCPRPTQAYSFSLPCCRRRGICTKPGHHVGGEGGAAAQPDKVLHRGLFRPGQYVLCRIRGRCGHRGWAQPGPPEPSRP